MNADGKNNVEHVFYDFDQINFTLVFFIISATFLSVILIQRLLPKLAEGLPSRFRFYILPLGPILRLIILIVAFISIMSLIIKPTIQNLVAIFGAAGLALGFAIYEKPYSLGDWVKIDEVYGEVKSMGLRSLVILTPDDSIVTIPHAKIWNTNIYNANAGKRDHLCIADFYLHPEHNAVKIRQTLLDVALTSPYLQIQRPVSLVVSEKPWGTHYRLKAYPLDNRDEFQFISDLTVRGKAAIAEIGIKPALVPVAVSE